LEFVINEQGSLYNMLEFEYFFHILIHYILVSFSSTVNLLLHYSFREKLCNS